LTAVGGRAELFATCPQSKDVEPAEYRQRVSDAAHWTKSEAGAAVASADELVLVQRLVVDGRQRQPARVLQN
jgi:hypothetical protein